MKSMRLAIVPAVLLAIGAAACGGRTTAATAPGAPKLFDPAGSDAKAVALIDEMQKAMGGTLAYDKAHEIEWEEAILIDGVPKLEYRHAWDRWNGRHHVEWADAQGHAVLAMYELWTDVGAARADGKEVGADAKANILDTARKYWGRDTQWLVLPYRLKDPGTHLKYDKEEGEAGDTEPKWDVVKVTYDKGVGPWDGDTYYVFLNKNTHLIDIVETVPAGKPDNERLAYKWTDWQDVGGLKFSTKRENIGYKAETLQFSNIQVHASSNEDLYVPVVQ